VSKAWDVLALGRACVDEILEAETYPDEDCKCALLARLREGGGQASTAACLVAHLGGRAAFLGILGGDEEGRFARARMEAFGVDVSLSPAPWGVTPLAYCIVSRSGETRTILYQRSEAAPLRWSEVGESVLAGCRAVLVDPQAEHLLPDLVPVCRRLGVKVVADAEHARDGWAQTWGRVDVLAVSETFLSELAPGLPPDSALARAAEGAQGLAVATLGPRGAIAFLEGRAVGFPAPRIEVRDSTGAGDAFHGALCLALARAFRLPDAIRYAVAAASLSCRGLGGRSFPTAAEVDALWPQLPIVAWDPSRTRIHHHIPGRRQAGRP